ncbi:chaperone modulator CbpM [Bacteroides sp. 519]|uniref:chaperone modulator CbpM n=1 Tax=Bacteroides sp. 519 TaxID=2302937 RepID=UPI0013D591D3|nr:chaperone modulator CbpM [Bacteroides sp. 519]NDV60368.1 hypothetical protein [Bacteroides sp. 519]
MQTDFIIIREYCKRTDLEQDFFTMLEDNGLIDTCIIEGEKLFPSSQLLDIERYARLYYDLSINIEGIDAIHHLLNRMKDIQQELEYFKNRLRLYE